MMNDKKDLWLWLLALFRKDMSYFKEGDKKTVYENVKQHMREESK